MTREWITPKAYIYLARQVLGDIDLDPASSHFAQRNVEATTYFTPEEDGLSRQWFGRVWLSPPNGRNGMPDFTGKLIDEFCAGRIDEAICLVPNSTDTRWFHRMAGLRMPACFKRGRVRFESPGVEGATPPNGQTFFYFGERHERFRAIFRPIGTVWNSVADCKSMADICQRDRLTAATNRAQQVAA